MSPGRFGSTAAAWWAATEMRLGMRRRPMLLRPAGFDELGLKRAISDRLLPFLVAAVAFLAALALAGAVGAASLARHWREGAGVSFTVQVPQPDAPAAGQPGSRREAVLTVLRGSPGIASARALTEDELGELLRPWLGSGIERLSLPLPAILEARLADASANVDAVAPRLEAVAPGTLTESHGPWIDRLTMLARSLEVCAGTALLVVAAVAAAVIAVATRAGLATRREAIEIVHGLGAADGYIAGRFAARATFLAGLGGLAGAGLALPVLLGLARLAAPFARLPPDHGSSPGLETLPLELWLGIPRPAARGGHDRISDRTGHGAALAPAAALRRALAAAGLLVCLGLSLWIGGFAWFVHRTAAEFAAPASADGIVALTGGSGRIEAALRLLAEGRARVALLSGIGGGAELRELAARTGLNPGLLGDRVTLGRQATSTHGNAS